MFEHSWHKSPVLQALWKGKYIIFYLSKQRKTISEPWMAHMYLSISIFSKVLHLENYRTLLALHLSLCKYLNNKKNLGMFENFGTSFISLCIVHFSNKYLDLWKLKCVTVYLSKQLYWILKFLRLFKHLGFYMPLCIFSKQLKSLDILGFLYVTI